MRVLLLTVGSRGDVEPFLALALALRDAGHEVRLATHQRFASIIGERGIDFAPLPDDLVDLLDSPEGRRTLERTRNWFGALLTTVRLFRRIRPIFLGLFNGAWAAARGFDPELIVHHFKAGAGTHIAERLGVPASLVMLQPMLVPTSAFPAFPLPERISGPRINRLTYALVHRVTSFYNRWLNAFRGDPLGLPPIAGTERLLRDEQGELLPVLHAFSPVLVPRPPDWPSQTHLTGFWCLPELPGWQPPPALEAFLAAGPAPVYVGFGSMAGRRAQKTSEIVAAALELVETRAVIATGWGGLDAGIFAGNPAVHVIEGAPHDWLFPQMRAVVHHGGAGTTAAGLRAGRPTVICPFFGDQPFWGRRVQALGAGPAPIAHRRLTPQRLARALDTVIHDQPMAARAAALGRRLRAERGTEEAVALTESLRPDPPAGGHDRLR